MTNRYPDQRILAIDLRTRRFGYAVFESPLHLLDWGATSYPSDVQEGPKEARRRFRKLLKLFDPSAVILRAMRGKDRSVALLFEAIQNEAFSRQVPIRIIKRLDNPTVFQGKGNDDTASALAERYPELLWKLPPKRKAWESERHNMIVFCAITAGLAYLQNDEAARFSAE